MLNLIGAFFITDLDADVGFPALRHHRDNSLYTATVDKDLRIAAFPSVIIDRFHFLQSAESDKTFDI